MTLRVTTLRDSFGRLKEGEPTEPPDLVLCLGDLDNPWLEARVEQLKPTYGAFAVRGNHDGNYPFPQGITDLNFRSQEIEIQGRKITLGGVPGSWRYKPGGHWLYEQDEMLWRMESLPPVDILLSHNSPANIGHERQGESLREDPEGVHQGFLALNTFIEEKRPKYLLHGHQHLRRKTQVGETLVIGAYGEDDYELKLS